jgi:xyloglucan fucosyltransferase
MDQKKVMRSHLSPWRGLATPTRRRWCQAAARPTTVLVIAVTVFAALLLAVVLFGVRLTPSGVSAGVRVVLKAGTYVLTLPRRCHACMDGSLAY